MTKLPSLTGKDILSILKKLGFEIKRQKGSHVFLQHPDGRATVVPIHSGETIGPGLIKLSPLLSVSIRIGADPLRPSGLA
jgi:predicted RNA binding protein YcfA (HicA-like mRNA interferase family)